MCVCIFFFCKQKTAYEMRISDWSSDVCSSDLHAVLARDDRDRMSLHRTAAGGDHGWRCRRCGSRGRGGAAVLYRPLAGPGARTPPGLSAGASSDERRVGRGGASTCSSRCSRDNKKQNKNCEERSK